MSSRSADESAFLQRMKARGVHAVLCAPRRGVTVDERSLYYSI